MESFTVTYANNHRIMGFQNSITLMATDSVAAIRLAQIACKALYKDIKGWSFKTA